MKILVYEHLSATAEGPAALIHEGDAMIRALLHDLAQVPAVRSVCLRAPGLPEDVPAHVLPYARDEDFARALQACDAAWLIAPESDDCLLDRARRVLVAGKRLINCTPEAIALCASKRRCARALHLHGVPVVPCYQSARDLPSWVREVVVKPDDGAGCMDTHVVTRTAAERSLASGRVFQPYVEGDARSFAMLCTRTGAQLLCVNAQRVERQGETLHFRGVSTNALAASAEITPLAWAVWRAIPGLRGYVGVDYIESAQGPLVLEINPRLTTAYVGMSAALGCNVAARVLAHMREDER